MIDINSILKNHNAYVLHNKDAIVSLVYDRDPAVLVLVEINTKNPDLALMIQEETKIDDVEDIIGASKHKTLAEGTPEEIDKEMRRLQRKLCAIKYDDRNTGSLTQLLITMIRMDRDRQADKTRKETINAIVESQYKETESTKTYNDGGNNTSTNKWKVSRKLWPLTKFHNRNQYTTADDLIADKSMF